MRMTFCFTNIVYRKNDILNTRKKLVPTPCHPRNNGDPSPYSIHELTWIPAEYSEDDRGM